MMTFEQFLTKPLPGTLLFARVAGSYGYNLNGPDSDMDFFVVYQAPAEKLLSLRQPPETVDGTKPDFAVHEIGKFCRLLLKGNPTIVEALWSDHHTYTTPAWERLRGMRRKFLSTHTVKSYLGYAKGQLQKLTHGSYLHTTGGKYNTKWACHLIRLLTDAKRIADGGEPVVWQERSERDILMSIRTGVYSEHLVEEMAKNDIAEIDDLIKPWKVPDKPDEAALDDWLVSLRRAEWMRS